MLGARRVGRDEGQVDLGLRRAGKLDLGLLGRLLEALQRQLVAAQVDALFALELLGQVVEELHVEIFAAEEGVAVGRFDLEDAVAELEDGNVEGAAAQVVDRDGAVVALVEAIGQGRRRGLVDDAFHVEPGDASGVLGGLALGVVEVGRNRDHGLADGFAKIGLAGFLHLLQQEGADLAGGVLFAARLDPGVAVVGPDDTVGHHVDVLLGHRIVHGAADQALDGKQRVFRVGHRLALGGLADQALAILGEGHHRGRGAGALGVLDHLGIGAVHDGDA